MVKKSTKQNKQEKEQELEQIDIFYFPKAFAPMYRVLREAVAEEIINLWKDQFTKVKRVSDHPEEGEAIVAYNGDDEVLRYYLNPTNISQAQVARDKDQMIAYLDQYADKYR